MLAASAAAADPPDKMNLLLNFDEKRQKECKELKRKLQVEASSFKKLTREQKEAQCRAEIDPEAEKVLQTLNPKP